MKTEIRPRGRFPLRCGRLNLVALAVVVAALAVAPAASARKLAIGMSGGDVRRLQERLAELSYLPPEATKGAFDQRRWHAVVAFQGWHGITPDGVAGARTRRALKSATRPPAARVLRERANQRKQARMLKLVRSLTTY